MSNPVAGVIAVVGRILLCAIFLISTVGNKIPHFGDVVKVMDGAGIPAPQVMLVGAIVFLIVGSLSVIVGYRARIGASLLLVFLVLATYYFHAFWKFEGPEQQQQMAHFLKNVALAGAMLLVIAAGPGPFGFDSRSKTKA